MQKKKKFFLDRPCAWLHHVPVQPVIPPPYPDMSSGAGSLPSFAGSSTAFSPAAPGQASAGGGPSRVLVTGSSRGLGRGIAIELARGGYSVAVQYAGDPGAASLTAELCARASRDGRQEFPVFRCDIADAGSRERLAEDVFGRLGGLEALVNNAGIAPRVRADILDAGEDSFDELVRTNVRGPYFLTQSVVRRWLASGTAPVAPLRRSVVFITSVSARTASINRGDYCISKAALSMAARLWAVRLAGEGIPVYEVRPGIMRTDMTSGVTAKYDALIAQGLVPQMRWGSPEDVGSAVRALLDGSFPFSTGSVVDVDGGLHIPRL